MNSNAKSRLAGAALAVILAVVFIPMLFENEEPERFSLSAADQKGKEKPADAKPESQRGQEVAPVGESAVPPSTSPTGTSSEASGEEFIPEVATPPDAHQAASQQPEQAQQPTQQRHHETIPPVPAPRREVSQQKLAPRQVETRKPERTVQYQAPAAANRKPASSTATQAQPRPQQQTRVPVVDYSVDRTNSRASAKPADKSATRVASAQQAKPSSVASSGRWMTQVASTGTRDSADALVARLQKAGNQAFVQQATVNGKTVYRVRMGPFASRNQASAAGAAASRVPGAAKQPFVQKIN